MSKIALITGATSGIGESVALKFAEEKVNLILTGRRQDRLDALKKKLEAKNVQVLALCFDVRDEKAVNDALLHLPQAWQQVDILSTMPGWRRD